jgi:hypothetical protein
MSLVKALAGDKLTFPQAIPKRRDLAEGGAVKMFSVLATTFS